MKDEEYQTPEDELPGGHDGHINLQELEVIHDLDTTSDGQIETTTIVVDQICLNEVLKLAQNKVGVNHKASGKQLLSSAEVRCCIPNASSKTCMGTWLKKIFITWMEKTILVYVVKKLSVHLP